MAKMQVYPNRENVPPHPIDGVLRPEGGMWTADQYTFRLIRDGDLTETPPDEGGAQRAARHHQAAVDAADDGGKRKPR